MAPTRATDEIRKHKEICSASNMVGKSHETTNFVLPLGINYL